MSKRHRWSAPARFAHKTERHCLDCGLVKVTRHEADAHPPHWTALLSEPAWTRVATLAHADGARERTEALWLNPACAARLAAARCPLFASAAS